MQSSAHISYLPFDESGCTHTHSWYQPHSQGKRCARHLPLSHAPLCGFVLFVWLFLCVVRTLDVYILLAKFDVSFKNGMTSGSGSVRGSQGSGQPPSTPEGRGPDAPGQKVPEGSELTKTGQPPRHTQHAEFWRAQLDHTVLGTWHIFILPKHLNNFKQQNSQSKVVNTQELIWNIVIVWQWLLLPGLQRLYNAFQRKYLFCRHYGTWFNLKFKFPE